jgi:hypothetical protein
MYSSESTSARMKSLYASHVNHRMNRIATDLHKASRLGCRAAATATRG